MEGLLTAKDLLAELVGELQDEYDPGTPTVVEIDERTWLADGRLPLEDLSEAISIDLPAGPYSTAAGLFMATSGRVPEEGDAVDVDRVRLVVLQHGPESHRPRAGGATPLIEASPSWWAKYTEMGTISLNRDVAQLGSAHRSGR